MLKGLSQKKQLYSFILGNLVSRFGDSIDMIAYTWLAYEISGSYLLSSIVLAFNGLPVVIIGLFAGVYSDIKSKKNIMMICDIGRMVGTITICILYLLNQLNISLLIIFTIVNSTFEAFSDPARRSIPPLIVEKEELLKINSWLGMCKKSAEILGIAASGIIIKYLGIQGALIIDSITFLVSFLSLIPIKIHYVKIDTKLDLKNVIKDAYDGFVYLKSSTIIFYTTLLATIANIFLGPFNLMTANFSEQVLKLGSSGHSIINTCFALGAISGNFFLSKIKKSLDSKLERLIYLGFICLSISYLLLSLSFNLITACLSCIALGISTVLVSVPSVTIIHKSTEKSYLGRVLSIIATISLMAIPVSNFMMGFILERYTINSIFIFSSLIIFISTLLFSNMIKRQKQSIKEMNR
ncbi:MFS transporter [Clostridium sp. D2Q-14]|uniref:MFS transporter n=1 Tax=Anaeromonas gelatinilytica TaxID=2683194 RepID=UPI00193B545D|nr:MFS transporter [Anaeromonas gelatinilytica]MBS4535041.1 MFS transporter [Anaeromonas gelatinilytica]